MILKNLFYKIFDIIGSFFYLFIDFIPENEKILITATYGVPYTPFTEVMAELHQDGTYKIVNSRDSWALKRAYKRLARPWYYGGWPDNYKFQSFLKARNNILQAKPL